MLPPQSLGKHYRASARPDAYLGADDDLALLELTGWITPVASLADGEQGADPNSRPASSADRAQKLYTAICIPGQKGRERVGLGMSFEHEVFDVPSSGLSALVVIAGVSVREEQGELR